MVSERLRLPIDVTDDEFNEIYPPHIRALSRKHWTPIAVVKMASRFLVTHDGTRVLDIGSGAGKFCLVGAAHTTGHFTGVEQRPELADLTTQLAFTYHLSNITSLHANITSIDFRQYQAFYFFNSFHENIDIHNKINDTIPLDIGFYEAYSQYVIEQLRQATVGARLATYCSTVTIVPPCFRLVDSLYSGRLNLWEKVH